MKHCTIDGCARPVLARGVCAPHYSTWHRAQRKYTIVCAHCGKTAQVQLRKNIYCSQACSSVVGAAAAGAKAHAEAVARRLPVLYTGPKLPREAPITVVRPRNRHRRLTSGYCKVCTAPFVSFNVDVTCSALCQENHYRAFRKTAKGRRRARKAGAYVEDVWRSRVFASDGYRCHLCRKKTLPDRQVPHPRAPTIDHVIPLSKGGTHEPANCRTACFQCNSLKRDGGSGEQMLLIAI